MINSMLFFVIFIIQVLVKYFGEQESNYFITEYGARLK